MANDEHVERLRAGSDIWNRWRTENPVVPNLRDANLRDADLIDADLSGANLSRASLNGAQLSGANLIEADLNGADLSGANVNRTNLGGASLNAADLSRAKLSGAILDEASLNGADLSGANFDEASLIRANLRGADLSGANLSRGDFGESDLIDADLSGANFSGASLIRANLSEVNLKKADLSGAKLNEANLSEADLSGADLNGADLSGTNLNGADLSGTNLNGADLSEANLNEASCLSTAFINVNLSTVKGLEHVRHRGPSSVGIDTLYKSKGKISEKFLRGCGLSDWEVETARLHKPNLSADERNDISYRTHDLLSDSPIQISPIFVSYSSKDSEFVDKLGEKLDKLHIRYWRDKKDETARRLDRSTLLYPTILVVLSTSSVNEPWVEYEVGKAVKLSRELERDVLCPIALDDSWAKSAQMSAQLRSQIEEYDVLFFKNWQNQDAFEREMKKLIAGLDLHYRNRAKDSGEPPR